MLVRREVLCTGTPSVAIEIAETPGELVQSDRHL